jgi:hypothetical protein
MSTTTPATPPTATAREDRTNRLFDYAMSHQAGFTVDDVKRDHGWSHAQTNVAIRDLREAFAGDPVNLVADPAGQSQRWIYRLVGDLAAAEGWTENRLHDADARLRTVKNVVSSIAAATDGRSTAGKRARLIYTTLDALEAQLAVLDSTP